MHNYADHHGILPPAAVIGKDGAPLLSWRVLLLPYIEQDGLYKEFRLDEPWDSPANIKLLPRMPSVYGHYDGRTAAGPGQTFFQVFVGPGATFEGKEGKSLKRDFPDGTSNTILIAEAAESVPWTKPADLVFDPKGPLPKLGAILPGSFRVSFADASASQFLSETVSEKALRAAVTRNGNDSVAELFGWKDNPR